MLCWFKPFSLSVCLAVLSTLSCRCYCALKFTYYATKIVLLY